MDSERPFGVSAAGGDAGDCSRPEANELGEEFGAGLGVTAWLPCPHSRMVDSFDPLIVTQYENGFPGHALNVTSLRLRKVKGKEKKLSIYHRKSQVKLKFKLKMKAVIIDMHAM